MTTGPRYKIAAVSAVIGGILILIGGGTGMVNFLNDLRNMLENMWGDVDPTVETIFWILIFIAALGGLAVIIGGLLIYKKLLLMGRILISLGAGIGVIGLILGLIMALYKGESTEFFSWMTTTFMGIGIILSIVAQFMAKR